MNPKPRWKRIVKPLAALAVVGMILAPAGVRLNRSLHQPPPPPRTVVARLGEMVVQVSETGTIEPVHKVDVKSKVAGRLLSIPIREGQRVVRGQLIALVDRTQIDPEIARTRAQLDQAQARLQQAIAAYDLQRRQTRMAILQAQAGLQTAQAHLIAVRASARPQELAQQQQTVRRAQIALEDAQRTQRRKQALAAKGFIAQSDADSAQVAVDTAASNLSAAQQQLALVQAGPRREDIADAQAQVDAARVQVASAQASIGQDEVRRSDIAQARASVRQTANDLAQLLVNLGDTRIVAPAAGLVLKKYKEPTEIVQSATTGFSDAQSIVATLGDRLMVRVGINEVDIPKVRIGAPVQIHVDALPGALFPGVVTEIAPASTNAFPSTGGSSDAGSSASISKFSVKVAFAREDSRLRPGMSAAVDIISQRHPHVVLVPQEAIPIAGNHGTVTVLLPGGGQQVRPVLLGLRDTSDVEIRSGVKAGDRLIVPPINGKGRRKIDIGLS